jgi:DNA-binding MarR family transcriptional regulator
MSALFAGLGDVRRMLADESSPMHRSRWREGQLSTSLLHGFLILSQLPADGSDVGNTELARRLGLSASTTHRYVSTLVALGLAERAPRSRRYRRAAVS